MQKYEHNDVIARSTTMREHEMKQKMNDIMTSYENPTWQLYGQQ
jgi:hypothetical protein